MPLLELLPCYLFYWFEEDSEELYINWGFFYYSGCSFLISGGGLAIGFVTGGGTNSY